MATKDNTVITLSGYDPGCEFRVGGNRAGITADSYTVTLNENESFVFETYIGTSPTPAHERGWIGASIESDKDIVISNGSLNFGRQAGSGNRDAGIDQPVPENRLGKEYVFIRGNGNANGWTEFPLIIATQNNTQIFVNGATTPIATINEGDFFEIPSSNYSSNTVGSNMLVLTSKDAYAYQCVGGSTNPYTQGLNFVSPVSCLLPDTMDNIPNITDVAGVTITGGVTIIAATTTPDSNITVIDGNGSVTLPSSLAVAGTSDWKTFYLPSLTGNVSVQSTEPIAVGFFGFNGARGVAGYYSGFDTVPDVNLQISGSNCLPGAFLEVANNEIFDAYQWYDGNGLIVGETSATYSPTMAGDYFLRVTKGTCSYDSNPMPVYYCDPNIVIKKTVDKSTVLESDTVNFIINIESWGIDPVTNLVVTDILPSSFTFVNASPSKGTWSNPNWTIGTLVSSELESIIITATVDDLPPATTSQSFTNTATHTQDQTDTNITENSPSASVLVNSDYDGDGVLDDSDLDDDNDGILDSIECGTSAATNLVTNGDFSSFYYDGWSPDGSNWQEPESGEYVFYEEYNTGTKALQQTITINTRIDYVLSFEIGTISTYTGTSTLNVLIDGALLYSITSDQLNIDNGGDTSDTGGGVLSNTSVITIPYTAQSSSISFEGVSAAQPHDEFFLDNVSITENASCSDTDDDGIPDYLDLDSDDDGCSDADEAYAASGTDSNNDGTYGGVIGNVEVNSNGLVVSAEINGAGDTYTTTPAINTISTKYTFLEVGTAPTISVQPEDEKVLLPDNAFFELTTNGNSYQWQVSIDAGSTFNNINDGSDYSGTTTDILTVISPDSSKNGYLFRVVLTNNFYVCAETISDEAILNISTRTVITNRRITYRVKKN